MNKVEFFCNMFKDASGWSENKNRKSKIDLPKVELKEKFNPKAFHEWHQSLFTGDLVLTVNNCIKLYKIVNFFTQTKIASKIQTFVAENLDNLNPFEVLDNFDNLEKPALSRILRIENTLSIEDAYREIV